MFPFLTLDSVEPQIEQLSMQGILPIISLPIPDNAGTGYLKKLIGYLNKLKEDANDNGYVTKDFGEGGMVTFIHFESLKDGLVNKIISLKPSLIVCCNPKSASEKFSALKGKVAHANYDDGICSGFILDKQSNTVTLVAIESDQMKRVNDFTIQSSNYIFLFDTF